MKKLLIGGLFLSLLLGLSGCPNGTTTPQEEPKVVEAKYRGEFWNVTSPDRARKLIIRETDLIRVTDSMPIDADLLTWPSARTEIAWTQKSSASDTILLYYNTPGSTFPGVALGHFEDENTFVLGQNQVFKRQ